MIHVRGLVEGGYSGIRKVYLYGLLDDEGCVDSAYPSGIRNR